MCLTIRLDTKKDPSIDPGMRYAKTAILDTTVCQSQLAKQIQILDTYKYYTTFFIQTRLPEMHEGGI